MLQRCKAHSRVTLQRTADKEQLSDIERKEGCYCREEESTPLSLLLFSFDVSMLGWLL